MGGKVIKINLMAVIGVILLIIAIITSIIIFAVRGEKSNEDKNKEEKEEKPGVIQEDKNLYSELDKQEFVKINNEDKEILMRTYEKNGEYRIDYDVNSFYVDETDKFIKSLISDSITLKIEKNVGFDRKSNELIASEKNRKRGNETYKLEKKNINGHMCYIESFENEPRNRKNIEKNYYIKDGNEYYIIRVLCGENFKDTVMPIVDKMVESFEII